MGDFRALVLHFMGWMQNLLFKNTTVRGIHYLRESHSELWGIVHMQDGHDEENARGCTHPVCARARRAQAATWWLREYDDE